MIRFEKINKIFGVRRLSDILEPRVLDDSEFVLPINSAIIEYSNEYIGNELYNRTPKKTYVFIADKYIIDPIGKFRRLNITNTAIISKLKRMDTLKEFRFVSDSSKLWSIDKNRPILIDAYRVKELYIYRETKSSQYDEYMNRLSNAIAYTKEPDTLTTRHIFLSIEIPKYIPSLSDIKRYSKLKGYRVVENSGDINILTILELIKELSGEESIFSVIPDKDKTDLVLLFSINGKISMIKYSYLMSLNAEFMIESPIKGMSRLKAVRLFLRYILKISITSASSMSELERDSASSVVDKAADDILEDDIDALIERHNDKYSNISESDTELKYDKTIKEIMEEKPTVDILTIENINNRVANGNIKEKVAEKIVEAVKEVSNELQAIKVTKEDLRMSSDMYPDSITVLDDNMRAATVDNMSREYLSKIYRRQQKESILSVTGAGHVVFDHDITYKVDINNAYEYHTFKIMQPNGKVLSRKIIVPKIDDEGYMTIGGNRYKMRKQKIDIPIKKISSTQVALMSYYSKVFIRKAEVNKNNQAVSIHKQLKARIGDDISMLLAAQLEFINVDVGLEYSTIARKVKSFKIGNIYCNFDYNEREKHFGKDIKSRIPFAKYGKSIYYIDKNDIVYKGEEKISTLYKWLKLDEKSLIEEYANIYILGTRIPLVLVLIYYFGIKSLLSITKTNYKTYGIREQIDILDNEMIIRFKDDKLVISKSDKYTSILFSALVNIKELRDIDFKSLDFKSGIVDLFYALSYSNKLPVELDNLKSLWVDPITRTALEYIKEPTSWIALLLRSAELLLDNRFKHPNDSSQIMIKGYERINGMIYNIISHAVRDNEHRMGNVSLKLDINPYELISMLSEDSLFILEEDLNPVASLKTKEDLTLTGIFGRSKTAISDKDKIYHKSNVGIISEATKDSKDVMVTSYMPLSPMIDNLLGIPMESKEGMSSANIYSTSVALAPETYRDDGKRALFVSIQNSHKIPTVSQRVLPVLTGMESVLPYRMDKKFVEYAREKGKVTKVTAKYITIVYKGKEKKYKLNSWTSREVGGKTYNHKLLTNLKEGDVVDYGDIIYYDDKFFTINIFNKRRVIYKGGDTVRVALDETPESYEDSGSISKDFSRRFASEITTVVPLILRKDYDISNVVKIGSSIKYSDTLLNIQFKDEDSVDLELSEKAQDIIKEQNRTSPKAKAKGKLIKIEIRYNCELDSMSDSIRELVTQTDKQMKSDYGFTGRVDSTYSIKGKPLVEGELEIKFFIEKRMDMQIADKAVLGNQLKFTAGKIFDKITDIDGNPIDLKFGYRSIGARIVNSPEIIGTTMLLLTDLDKQIVKEYFK